MHTLTEAPVVEWKLLSITCDNPDDGTVSDPATGQVNIDLDPRLTP